ncbi:TasA family protein, partial [Bacillus mobilis]|uniref:TasA family protein n=2 Tax=Bacillati TaxID=1783272 RepID=UPI00362F09D1
MKALPAAVPANLLRLGAGALGLAAVGVLLVQGSSAAFTASTDSKGNVVESGTVVLTNDGSSTAMFNVGNLNGGQTVTRCVNVAYNGSLTSDIKLETIASGDLAAGLATTVEVGSGATGGTGFDCTGFTGGTSQYTGTLADLSAGHGTYANGLGGYTNAVKG